MGINPKKFGPYFWGVLHLACLGGIDPAALRTLIDLFPAILPCGACGQHFAEVLKESPPPESDDPEVLFKWSVDVHNIVNRRIEKPVYGYDEAIKIWLSMPAPPAPIILPKKKDRSVMFILVALTVIAAILLWKIRC